MKECAFHTDEVPLRGRPDGSYCWQDNELYTLFQPIVGKTATVLYCQLTRRAYGATFTFSLRELSEETGLSRTTLWRELSVLGHIGMVRLRKGKGNQNSNGELVNLKKLSVHLGAGPQKKASSYVLPSERITQLKERATALRLSLQGKRKVVQEPQPHSNMPMANLNCGNHLLPVSQRDAGVSPVISERPAEETKAGSHLIQQDTRLQNSLSPTPFHEDKANATKSAPNEDESQVLLKWAEDQFTGVIDDMRAHLLDASRPPVPHLANGFADWEKYGFSSLAVERAAWRGEALALVLSAFDPAAARRGLDKYSKKWEASLRKWYEYEVNVELQQAQRKW